MLRETPDICSFRCITYTDRFKKPRDISMHNGLYIKISSYLWYICWCNIYGINDICFARKI